LIKDDFLADRTSSCSNRIEPALQKLDSEAKEGIMDDILYEENESDLATSK